LKGYAKSAERYNDTYSAIDYYSEYLKRKPDNFKISKKLADLYLKANNYTKASELFLKNYKINTDRNLLQLFYYAQTLKNLEKYDSAIACFEMFNNSLSLPENVNSKKSKKNQKITNEQVMFYFSTLEIEGCKIAVFNPRDSVKIVHLDENINSLHIDFSPVIINDSTFYYASLNQNYIPQVEIKENPEEFFTKFYLAKKSNHQWIKNDEIEQPFINYDTANVANGVFSPDKTRFYFSVSKRNWKYQNISAIYVTEKKTGFWTKPKKLGNDVNLKNYSSTQPAIGNCFDKNLEIIYFVSDRKGGVGGQDIWYTVYEKQSGKYKKPVNAGTYINTPKDEITPSYDINSKTMYFSSKGFSTIGGFDVFKISGELVNWTKPENMGKPVNSSFDDFYYVQNSSKDFGFIVSNRTGTYELKSPNCCYDIFEYTKLTSEDIFYEGVVFEEENNLYNNIKENFENDTLKYADKIINYIDSMIVVLEIKNDNTGENIYLHEDTTNITGEFGFELETNKDYVLSFDSDDYINSEIEVSTHENIEYVKQLIGLVINPSNSIIINNIYFEFDDVNLTAESKELIDTSLFLIMKEYPQIIVEISAHTDYIGTEEYNQDLSQQRANSVVNYLSSKGIEKERMKPVGYGELIPIVSAINPDGTDIPLGREKNRRIEFKIVGIK
jgi:outer membrane protein OmpA-like peptidoglycan-associated protein/tetratricopeptide (TPR) repeat protein